MKNEVKNDLNINMAKESNNSNNNNTNDKIKIASFMLDNSYKKSRAIVMDTNKERINDNIIEFKNYANLSDDEIDFVERKINKIEISDICWSIFFDIAALICFFAIFEIGGSIENPLTHPSVRIITAIFQSLLATFVFHTARLGFKNFVDEILVTLFCDDEYENDDNF